MAETGERHYYCEWVARGFVIRAWDRGLVISSCRSKQLLFSWFSTCFEALIQ